MMIYEAFNLQVDPVKTEMTDTQHIPISNTCDSGESESNKIIAEEKLSQVWSMDEIKSESVIFN